MQAELTLTRDGRLLKRHQITPGAYIIGRDSTSSILVDDEDVSRQHARLTVRDGDLLLEDLGSSNGTFVDGAQVAKRVSVRPGQVIQLGHTTLTIQVKTPENVTRQSPVVPAAPAVTPRQVRHLQEYELGETVARGGMGVILHARDAGINRTVAMKVVLDEREAVPELVERFRQEGQITGQLEHPNIVPVHELGTDEHGRAFYTMKFVQGVTLHEVLEDIKRGDAGTLARYPLAHLLTIFQKVCDAVAFAHSKGVIHRDLKPANIMIGDYGEVLVMDWGLAKRLRSQELVASRQPDDSVLSPESLSLTMAGQVMGTPQFMAPEQAEGKVEEIDARTDIFSLGAILYNLLTLHPVVSGDSVQEVLEKIRRGEILPPTSFNQKSTRGKGQSVKVGVASVPRPPLFPLRHIPGGRIPESLSAVCMKALALRQEDRYPSVQEFQKDIEAYQGGFATSAERAGVVKLLWLLIKRHKVEAIAAAVIIVLVAGFMVKVIASGRRTTRALTELRQLAPALHSEVLTLIKEHRLEEALERITHAITLRPDLAEYQYLRGNISQSLFRFTEAQAAYTRALELDRQHRLAAENLALTKKLVHMNQGLSQPSPPSLLELQAAMRAQERFDEAVGLLARMDQDQTAFYETYRGLLKQAGVSPDALKADKKGFCQLNLRDTSVSDLSLLRGLPITELRLDRTRVMDLTPLRGMPLETLYLDGAPVKNLRPLAGMRLRKLSLSGVAVTDLSPLQGMPLEWLHIAGQNVVDLNALRGMPLSTLLAGNNSVTDLSPLRGMPLRTLDLGNTPITNLAPLTGIHLDLLGLANTPVHDLRPLRGTKLRVLIVPHTDVADLSPLQGMPLEELQAYQTRVSDLSALRGMPLKRLTLDRCDQLRDVSALADCPQLENLTIPTGCAGIEVLRSLPNLKRIGYNWPNAGWEKVSTAAEFWKEYDVKKQKESGVSSQ